MLKNSIYDFWKINPKDLCKIKTEPTEMPRLTSTRLLGFIVDENSNGREQADWVGTKVNKSIGIIRRVSHLVSRNCLLTLYYSLIYPYLSYCNIVWATFPTTLHKILVLQKRFVRITTWSESYAISTPLFKKLQVLTIYDNIFNVFMTIFFKSVFLFMRYIQVQVTFLSILCATLKQIHRFILTQLGNLQIFNLFNF